jgi:hypothetical protein
MALHKYALSWATTALVTATPKTIVELPTPAASDIEIAEIIIGLDASTAGNVRIELGTFTTTGTGTAVAQANIVTITSSDRSTTSDITAAKVSDTVEPAGFTTNAGGNAVWPGVLMPLPCYFPFQTPLYEGMTLAHSTLFAIRLTASIGCNTMGWIAWKE